MQTVKREEVTRKLRGQPMPGGVFGYGPWVCEPPQRHAPWHDQIYQSAGRAESLRVAGPRSTDPWNFLTGRRFGPMVFAGTNLDLAGSNRVHHRASET